MLFACASAILRVSSSNLTKPASLAHSIAQFVEQQQGCSYFGPPCRVTIYWVTYWSSVACGRWFITLGYELGVLFFIQTPEPASSVWILFRSLDEEVPHRQDVTDVLAPRRAGRAAAVDLGVVRTVCRHVVVDGRQHESSTARLPQRRHDQSQHRLALPARRGRAYGRAVDAAGPGRRRPVIAGRRRAGRSGRLQDDDRTRSTDAISSWWIHTDANDHYCATTTNCEPCAIRRFWMTGDDGDRFYTQAHSPGRQEWRGIG